MAYLATGSVLARPSLAHMAGIYGDFTARSKGHWARNRESFIRVLLLSSWGRPRAFHLSVLPHLNGTVFPAPPEDVLVLELGEAWNKGTGGLCSRGG